MLKEEKIKKEWENMLRGIASFSYIEGYISLNGWLPMNLLSQGIRFKLSAKTKQDFELNGDFIRPTSLAGIETNNGWVKVSSEADYPLDDCRYWIANENGVFDFFANKERIVKKFENKTLTHYKKLEETLPPVF